MGDVSRGSMQNPEAIERRLSWGTVVRGLRWGGGSDLALLLHEPGEDLDAWAALPGQLARELVIESIAVDLPGHGLSDDPWEPARLPDVLRELPLIVPAANRLYVIAAGTPALVSLDYAADLKLSGLVSLSPESPSDDWNPTRSPSVPKLMIAGAIAGSDLETARRLASTCGGWVVVTSIPVAERGTGLLSSPWSGRLVEQIVAFLRDCQRRPARATNPIDSTRPATANASDSR